MATNQFDFNPIETAQDQGQLEVRDPSLYHGPTITYGLGLKLYATQHGGEIGSLFVRASNNEVLFNKPFGSYRACERYIDRALGNLNQDDRRKNKRRPKQLDTSKNPCGIKSSQVMTKREMSRQITRETLGNTEFLAHSIQCVSDRDKEAGVTLRYLVRKSRRSRRKNLRSPAARYAKALKMSLSSFYQKVANTKPRLIKILKEISRNES